MKKHFRPVILVPHSPKVLGRIIYKQINIMKDKLTKGLTSFKKSHGTQQSLLTMFEKFKRAFAKEEYVSALFMDHSKAIDTINHDHMLTKSKAYEFSTNAPKQVQIKSKFSLVRGIITGVSQGSKDRPFLLNLFLNEVVLFYSI